MEKRSSNSLIDPLGNNSHNTIPLGLSFDDVLLIPNKTSVVSRKDSNTSTYFSRRIPLSIPIVSSNMDTVTETNMAIAMAREGGIGIIHRFMTAEEQIEQVLNVKRSESILIERPYTLPLTSKLGDAWKFLEKKAVSGILIIDENHKLQGILTSRDMQLEENAETPVSELMTKNPITATQGIDIQDAKQILKQNKIEKLPVVDMDGKLTGLITMKDIKKSKLWPKATKDEKGRLLVGAAIGVKKGFLDRTEALYNAECDVIVIDIAHGHSISVIDTIKQLRVEFGDDLEIIAGNVATAQGTAELISHGADGIKVGVGPGSICFEEDAFVTMSDYTVKKIKDVNVGDKVITHANNIQEVVKTYIRNHEGEILEINAKGSPGKIRCTPEHPLLGIVFEDVDLEKLKKNGSKYYFDKKKYNKGLQWVEAKNLKRGDILVVPRSTSWNKEKVILDMTKYNPGYEHDSELIWTNKKGFNPNLESYVNLAGRFNTTVRIINNIVKGGKSMDMVLNQKINKYLDSADYDREILQHKVNRFVAVDHKFMRLIGYYIAEGYVIGNPSNRQVCFAFSKDEVNHHDEIIELVHEIFGYTGSKVLPHKERHSAVVHVYSNAIASLFDHYFPYKAQTKILPEFILNQDEDLLKSLLIGAINGDGSIREKRRASYKTTSPSLAFQLSEIMTRLGYMPTMTVDHPKIENHSDIYRLNISGKQYDVFMKSVMEIQLEQSDVEYTGQQSWQDDNYIYHSIMDVKTVQKNTMVYNLEVEEDNTYLVNRFSVHNCITRIVSGAGVPQLTAIQSATSVAHDEKIPLIADGGIKTSGDIAKAIGIGASTVMLGNLLAGTSESPGFPVLRNGRRVKIIRGMASLGASLGRDQRVKGSFGDEEDLISMAPEGVEAVVPYRGQVKDVLNQLVSGFRSGMSYVGARTVDEMWKKSNFIRITSAGKRESQSHDVDKL